MPWRGGHMDQYSSSRFRQSLGYVFLSLADHAELVWRLALRDVLGRYRGSLLGLFWSFLNPIIYLAIYTFVFGSVFKTRWGTQSGGIAGFALILYAGLIANNLFADCINRAPRLLLENPNYVKRVVFPLEILPWVSSFSALFHAVINLLVLVIFYFLLHHEFSRTLFLLPIILVPYVVLITGIGWFLSALGVFVRDISQLTSLITVALLFLAPIFYPMSALPKDYLWVFELNPVTFMVEQLRDVALWGRWPDWSGLALYSAISLAVSWIGLIWFQRTRRGFADVI